MPLNEEEQKFIINIDRSYIEDPNAVIKYDPFFGGTYKGSYSYVKLTWDAQDDEGLEGYNVYYSVHPLTRHKANKDSIISNAEYEMSLPLYPNNIIFYFWVSKVVNGTEIFLNEEGQNTYDSAEQETFEENPMTPNNGFPETDNINDQLNDLLQRSKDDKKMALQMVGVKCDVYLRRWGAQEPFGTPCSCTEDRDDPDNMGSGRCPLCFGTGITGGYYPPIEMYIRFPNKPANDFKGTVRGLTLSQTYDAWTIVPPILREQDLIVRKIDGRRWITRDVQVSFFRGAATMQYFSLDLIMPTDIRYIVSLDTINQALSNLTDPRYNAPRRNIF